MNTLLQRKR